MSVRIVINNTPIDFPSSGASPNWSPAVIEFAQAVETALSSLLGAGDISPQVYTMPNNVNTNESITNLAFSNTEIQGALIVYTVYRQTDNPNPSDTIVVETGQLQIVYNPNNSSTQKWEKIREGTGDAGITFTITDAGQVQYSTTSQAGSNHVGRISFRAYSLQQS